MKGARGSLPDVVDLARRGQGEGVQGEHGGAVQGVLQWCRGLHFKEEETEAHRDDVGTVARTSGGSGHFWLHEPFSPKMQL